MLKLVIPSILLFLITIFVGSLSSKVEDEGITFIAPPKGIERFSFGYSESFADSLWVRLIQDIGICGLEDHEARIKAMNGSTVKNCDQSWSFKMLDVITDLSPRFGAAYWHGAAVLSVLGTDPAGTTKIFEKGTQNIPEDWVLSYRAGYHYLAEVKDIKKAAAAIRQAADSGGPGWLYALAGQLYTKAGQAMLSKSMLEGFIKQNPNHRYIKRFKARLDEANYTLGLSKQKPDFKAFPRATSK